MRVWRQRELGECEVIGSKMKHDGRWWLTLRREGEARSSWAGYRGWDPVHRHLIGTRKVYFVYQERRQKIVAQIQLKGQICCWKMHFPLLIVLISQRNSKWDHQLWARKGEQVWRDKRCEITSKRRKGNWVGRWRKLAEGRWGSA